MKSISVKIILIVCTIAFALNLLLFIFGSIPLKEESPVRIVLGFLLIFILPGLCYGEILRFKSSHFLETIALSFALTLCIEIILLPLPFIFGATIRFWVLLLIIVCALGLLLLFLKIRSNEELTFLKPFVEFSKQPISLRFSAVFILIILILTSYGTYRWGELLTDISGEKFLHLVFVRYYYSMPLALNNLAIFRGAPPTNLINLWEYLISGWAALTHLDPLPLFFRARFAIPILGFSSMFLLIKSFFSDKIKSEIIFWTVIFLGLGGIMLLSPSSLDWVKGDPYRLCFSFMGTVHHADAGMEILLALGTGLALLAFRRVSYRILFLLFGVLIAIFMWHPREFFQIFVYTGIFGLAKFFWRDVNLGASIKRLAIVIAPFILVLAVFWPMSNSLVSKKSQGYDEFAIKKEALKSSTYKENILGVRNLFNFPFHFTLSSSRNLDFVPTRQDINSNFKKDWQFSLWIILAALAIPFLALWGDREDRRLTFFLIIFWFLILAWNFGMLWVIILTYSEFYITTPRLLYLFAYIVLGASLVVISRKFAEIVKKLKYFLIFSPAMAVIGFGIHLWWKSGAPHKNILTVVLSVLASLSLVVILFRSKKDRPSSAVPPALFIPATLGIFLFFSPIIWGDLEANFDKILHGRRPPIDWFGDTNPFGFSGKLIQYLTTLPPQKTFLVYPLGNGLIPAYVPQYVAVVPEIIDTIISVSKDYADTRNNRNPLFISENATGVKTIDHEAVIKWLNQRDVDYILIEKDFYASLSAYFEKFPETFNIVFNYPQNGEMVVSYTSR